MTTLTIEMPDDVFDILRKPPCELGREVRIALPSSTNSPDGGLPSGNTPWTRFRRKSAFHPELEEAPASR
jgi:hypothetical protein